MTLHEYATALFELLRNGSISDDEKLDYRLMYDLIKTKRVDALARIKPSAALSFNNTQELNVNMTLGPHGALKSDPIPNIVNNSSGALIDKIYGSTMLEPYLFSIVPVGRLPYVGNGSFNQNIVFAAVAGDTLYLKAANDAYRLIENCVIDAVFEDPTDVPDFNVETDRYPMDMQIFEYIKKKMFEEDLNYFLTTKSDLTNDADGEV